MPLERIVQESLTAAAATAGIPERVARRLELLVDAIAEGELDPTQNRSEVERRLDVILDGFDV
jgi:hypothetical protein